MIPHYTSTHTAYRMVCEIITTKQEFRKKNMSSTLVHPLTRFWFIKLK